MLTAVQVKTLDIQSLKRQIKDIWSLANPIVSVVAIKIFIFSGLIVLVIRSGHKSTVVLQMTLVIQSKKLVMADLLLQVKPAAMVLEAETFTLSKQTRTERWFGLKLTVAPLTKLEILFLKRETPGSSLLGAVQLLVMAPPPCILSEQPRLETRYGQDNFPDITRNQVSQ